MTALAELMARTDAVLLDFDGPICRVFAGHSAAPVALELRRFRRFLEEGGVISVNDDRNPEQLLLWVGEHHADLTCAADDLLTVYENAAVQLAEPTDGAADVIRAAAAASIPVAIVSNNSESAIASYLTKHDLASGVAAVIGRPYGDPSRMKPHPDSVIRAAEALDVSPDGCIFVGDSASDMRAAAAAGVRGVGYVKTPERATVLRAGGADVLIDHMSELAAALEAIA